MTPERWRQIEDLYHAALERDGAARAAFLAHADPELRAEVESLLAQKSGENRTLTRGLLDVTITKLATGTQLGPYRIEGPLGAGGMGEVFRATDTRLGRSVAIKTSQEQFSDRFNREARAISSLNHPHICTLYDVGPNYLVMELCEGETLAARLKRGKLSIDETIRYGAQIADALSAAHGKGIVHRDLKPQNVMLTKAGVKVLDFGLAKAPQDETLTGTRMVLGTPAYMAPEQREGKECDARTDIYALGLVLCEIATGSRVGPGTTPSLDSLPPQFAHVVQRCLEKDPEDRWQSASDVRKELQWSAQAPPPSVATPQVSSRGWLFWTPLTVTALALALLAWIHFRETPPVALTTRLSLALPAGTAVNSFELSPDGRMLAMSAVTNGKSQLWLRQIDALQAQPLAFTEDAVTPFWSPDSHYIGYFAQGKLRKLAAVGGSPQVVCDAPLGRFGSWSRDDVIIFGAEQMQRVAAAGGTATNVFQTTQGAAQPRFLPDGRHFLYWNRAGEQPGIYVDSLDGKESKRILPDESNVVFAPATANGPAHILFVRESMLMAVPFDPAAARVLGDAFPIADGIAHTSITYAPFSVSDQGTLIYATADSTGGENQLTLVDRSGKLLERVGSPGPVMDPALSPDGTRVAYRRGLARGSDIWVHDVARGTELRVTSDPALDAGPIWSPQGDRIAFFRNGASVEMLVKTINSSAPERQLLQQQLKGFLVPQHWPGDGSLLVYCQNERPDNRDLWTLRMDVDPPERKAFLQSPYNESFGQVSPDSRWMAFTSEANNHREVYVRPFPSGPGELAISTAGGEMPRWRRDGKELFFESADHKIMSVFMSSDGAAGLKAAVPIPLFDSHMVHSTAPVFEYDVAGDGQRFLMNTMGNLSPTSVPLLTVVHNWQSTRQK